MNVIVTGAAGLVGVNFVEYLLSNSEQLNVNKIYGIDDLSGGYIENLPKNNEKFRFIQADLTDKANQMSIEEIFSKEKIAFIFHFAAYAPEGLSPFIRQYNYTQNIIPTAFLVNMAVKYNVKRFIFTSSMATYGENTTPYTEDMRPNPKDPYGIAKYACELDLKTAYEQYGLEYCIILPHNIYGKYQNIWDPYRNVLGIWMYQATQNQPFTIYGDGAQTRAFSYIDDILPCLWKSAVSAKAKNQRINLGGKHEISLNDAVDIVARVTGKRKVVYLEPRYEVKHAWCCWKKSEEILDYFETTDLEKGIKLMWDWVKTQPERPRKFWQNYELERNIYSYWQIKK